MKKKAGVHEKGSFSFTDLIDSVKKQTGFERVGAIGVFIGVVRGMAGEGRVSRLQLQAYEEKADEVLAKICEDLKKKPNIVDVQIHHLLGDFEVGEDLVYVLVAGGHRQQVFPVLEEAVERYKKEAPIFKKELIATEKGNKAYWTAERRDQ